MKTVYNIFIAKMRQFERCSPFCDTTYIVLSDRGRAVRRKFVGVGGGLFSLAAQLCMHVAECLGLVFRVFSGFIYRFGCLKD